MKPPHGLDLVEGKNPSGAKARVFIGSFMYGLKPVPFGSSPHLYWAVHVRAKARTLRLKPVPSSSSRALSKFLRETANSLEPRTSAQVLKSRLDFTT